MSYDPLLFNVDPYYDDYSEDKKFLRMLFRPGYAVQARELTQLQTILQNQIERFGKNIFNEGSLVYGGEVVENRVKFARVSSLTGTQVITDLIGGEISNANVSGKIVHAETALTGSSSDTRPVVFFEYTSGGTGFTAGDTIGGTASNSSPFAFTIGGITAGSLTGQSMGNCLLVSVAPGIRFINGFFVSNDKQTIAAASLTGVTGSHIRLFESPTTRVGFLVNKEIVTDTDDTTLRDPSYGFYNYAAPGADRFKIDLPLTQYGYSEVTDVSTAATNNFSRENFIEFIRVVNGNVIKREQYPDYSVLGDTLARRTFDESGNYTVEPFQVSITDEPYGATGLTFSVVVSPGKAYVFGYEFETIGNTRLDLPKARTTTIVEDANIQSVVGPYVLGSITGNNFPPNGLTTVTMQNMPTVLLSSGSGVAGASAFTQVGTAKLRGLQYQGGNGDKNWRVDLFDISLSSGIEFSTVKSLFVPGRTAGGQQLVDFYSPASGTELIDFTNTLLFPTSAGGGVSAINELDYKVRFAKKIAFSATGAATITTNDLGLGTNQALAKFDYGSGVNAPANTLIVIDESGDSVSASAITGTAANEIIITNGPNGATGTVIGEVRLNYNSGTYVRRGKTVTQETISVTGPIQTDVGPTGAVNGSEFFFINRKVDVFEVSSVTGPSGQDFSQYFVLDTGNRDNYYDWSRLAFAPGFTSGYTAGLTGPLNVTLRRFARTGITGGPFTVDSYSTVDFSDIPVYTSPDTGKTHYLSDMIDFRPDRLPDNTFSPFCYPVSTSTGLITVERYLPRTDKLVLSKNRSFKIVSGLPSPEAAVPPDDPNSMTLYTITLPPYTYSRDDVSLRAVKNKRYTMQDIGNLERRIDSVEYYTTMSLLEQEAKNTAIVDSQGIEVPKKGILVDTFRGHNIGDVKDSMYNAAIDPETSSLRPAFQTKIYRLSLDSAATPSLYNYSPSEIPLSITGNRLFTIGYTGTPGIIQPQASSSRQLNPFGVINYTGTLFTNPDSDFWFADTARPSVKVNPRGERDNWAFSVRGSAGAEGGAGAGEGTGFGTQWNDWETMWFGKSNFDETTNNLFNKTSDDMSVSANINSQFSGLIDRNASPESIVLNKVSEKTNNDVEFYARNIEVMVRGDGLKPNTKMYAFVDDTTTPSNITVTLQGATGVSGFSTVSYITTDSKGSFGGLTAGSLGYSIRINQNGNVKTGPRLIRFTDSSTNDITTTTTVAEKLFYIEGGYGTRETDVLSTRKPLIKRASPSSPTIVNNIFGKETSSTATSKGIVEPLSQSFFIDPIIYPYGVFVSSVDLWFKTKDTSSVGVPVILELKTLINGYPHPSKTLPTGVSTVFSDNITVSEDATSSTRFRFNSPIYLSPGAEYCFSLRTTSDKFSLHTAVLNQTQYKVDDSDPSLTVTKQPYVRSLFTAQTPNTLLKEVREDLKFVVNFCKFDRSTASVIQTKNVPTNYYGTSANPSIVRVEIPTIVPPGTSISVKENGPGILGTSDTNILLGKNINRTLTDSVGLSADFTTISVNLVSNNDYVSPMVDLDRSCIVLVESQMNNNKVGTTNTNGEESPTNRGVSTSVRSASRYITKKINLENPATQLDVYLKISNPPNTGVEVFARTLPDETDSNTFFQNRGYTKMTAASIERNTAEGEYQDIRYTLALTDDKRFSTFSIKVVLHGTNDVSNHPTPIIKSMKVIAT